MVKNFLLKIGQLRAGVRLDGLLGRIANRRYKTAALLAASLLVLEFVYLALIWPKAPVWTIKGLPVSFQWGSLDFQQTETSRLPISIESISGVSPDYFQTLSTQDGDYFIMLAWRQDSWSENAITAKLSDFLAKNYPDRRQLVLPDRTTVTESIFAPETVIKRDLPAFNLRLLKKNGHSMAFLISRNTIVFSNHPAALFNLLTVDK